MFAANGCVSCHGVEGRGDGPLAPTLVKRPRDLHDAASFRNGTTEVAIATTLADGLRVDGGQMPTFSHLTQAERQSIALFVISLRDAPGTTRSAPR